MVHRRRPEGFGCGNSDIGPLFSSEVEDGDCASGAIYVARSLSDNQFVQENREILHKIGLTTGDPEKRVSNAKKETTYLFAAVELVAVYRLANINCKAFESLLHKFLARARIDMALADRFGGKVQPREWFLVPLPVIEEVVGDHLDWLLSKISLTRAQQFELESDCDLRITVFCVWWAKTGA